jgi:hypothetical protein
LVRAGTPEDSRRAVVEKERPAAEIHATTTPQRRLCSRAHERDALEVVAIDPE